MSLSTTSYQCCVPASPVKRVTVSGVYHYHKVLGLSTLSKNLYVQNCVIFTYLIFYFQVMASICHLLCFYVEVD